MASFQYIVIDKYGKEKKGSMEAVSEEKVTSILKADGYIPLKITEQNLLTKDINITIGNPVKTRELGVFCRQFYSILHAGIPMIHALDMLSNQTENAALKKAIKETQMAVEKGETLTGAMKVHNHIFPAILINMVEAGEASGKLDNSFIRMSSHFEKEAKLKATVKKAMIYPAFVGIVAVGVIIVMLLVVIPQFTSMFGDLNVEMPFITKMVIAMSDGIVHNWFYMLVLLIITIVAIHIFKNSEIGKEVSSKVSLKLPLVGKLIIKTSSARLGRTLSTLLASGIPLIEAIDITGKITDNVVLKNVLLKTKEDVTRGVPLSSPLEQSGIFPPMVYQMVHIGEETGQLENMLEKIADYYEDEVEVATQSLIAVLEPLMIIILALFVGIILVAIFSPMMSIYEGVENI